MALIKALKAATSQVADGGPTIYGFSISLHSPTTEFETLSSIEMNSDDGTYSPEEQEIINDFIELMTLKLL